MDKKRGFTAAGLKAIAAFAMLADHTYKVFQPQLVGALQAFFHVDADGGQLLLLLFCGATSISFYIFAYFCGESCRYTWHRRRYLRNLFAFALLSELPFQLLLDIIQGEPLQVHWGLSNVMFTLLLGVLACFGFDALTRQGKRGAGALFVLLCAGTAGALGTDYGAYGVAAVFICYFCENPRQRLLALGAVIVLQYVMGVLAVDFFTYGYNGYALMETMILMAYALCALPLLSAYNGQRGRGWRYFFYIFYPAHIALLVCLYVCLEIGI